MLQPDVELCHYFDRVCFRTTNTLILADAHVAAAATVHVNPFFPIVTEGRRVISIRANLKKASPFTAHPSGDFQYEFPQKCEFNREFFPINMLSTAARRQCRWAATSARAIFVRHDAPPLTTALTSKAEGSAGPFEPYGPTHARSLTKNRRGRLRRTPAAPIRDWRTRRCPGPLRTRRRVTEGRSPCPLVDSGAPTMSASDSFRVPGGRWKIPGPVGPCGPEGSGRGGASQDPRSSRASGTKYADLACGVRSPKQKGGGSHRGGGARTHTLSKSAGRPGDMAEPGVGLLGDAAIDPAMFGQRPGGE
jgi:hypothetical protein